LRAASKSDCSFDIELSIELISLSKELIWPSILELDSIRPDTSAFKLSNAANSSSVGQELHPDKKAEVDKIKKAKSVKIKLLILSMFEKSSDFN
jgi:hypothetical protein